MSFKVGNIQKHYQTYIQQKTKKQKRATKLKTLQTSSWRSTVQTSTEHVLWKRGRGHCSNTATSLKGDTQPYERKHDSAICPSRILSMATENRVDVFNHSNGVSLFTFATELDVSVVSYHGNGTCQHFTIATEHKHLIRATQLFNHNFTTATWNVETLP